MKPPFLSSFIRSLQNANRWLLDTPERALDQAYDAALKIQAIENEHFGGTKISNAANRYSENTFDYFRAELKRLLKVAEIRLTEFRASRVITNSTNPAKNGLGNSQNAAYTVSGEDQALILEKLKFIDQVLERYKPKPAKSTALVPVQPSASDRVLLSSESSMNGKDPRLEYADLVADEDDGILDKTGVLPRSILGTVSRIKRDLDPRSEDQVIQNFRSTKAKTLISIRLILLLIIIPLLTQQVTKALIFPLVDHHRSVTNQEIFINYELEEEALQELRTYEQRLRFEYLLGDTPKLTDKQIDERLQEKAEELAQHYKRLGTNAIANVFADLFSLVAFALVLINRRAEVPVLKSFMDETIYGLSDSAKAFIIILFTDMFVGFHSPHGWEVLLEGVAKHLGLPPSRDFIFLFIATFPVILDTIFKYWIFRYLNRISPSAVATYRSMNE